MGTDKASIPAKHFTDISQARMRYIFEYVYGIQTFSFEGFYVMRDPKKFSFKNKP